MTVLFDLDSHLQMGAEEMVAVFGHAASVLPGAAAAVSRPADEVPTAAPQVDPATVWQVKGSRAPGAAVAADRVSVLDAMGVGRQLVLPRVRVALAAWRGDEPAATGLVRRYNDFIADWQRPYPERLYGAGILTMRDPESAVAEAVRAAEAGLRAVLLPCVEPPGGRSPADPAWEPLWRTLSESGLAVILHAGSESGFVDSRWKPPADLGFTDRAEGVRDKIDVETVDLFKLITMQYGPQILLSSLVLGGVLERFPDLRFAVLELGADWVAPFVRMLDARVREFGSYSDVRLTCLPSEVLLRQLRVSPFHWEAVADYLADEELFPLYSFSTDFPHSEGGQQTYPIAERTLAHLPEPVRRSYFSESAGLILRAG
ncbi:MAG: amidohydrolase protein [Nocardia sp.]|uniref:amidohydrolase family protein n=1 Tax=Nocardia sp. TaxID=1821 RepID=UPI00262C7571|nr:amidohydrolase family protein [Nocardia sp.]MCU1640749.1 amidohydrolase protein [Nocardia sp.]